MKVGFLGNMNNNHFAMARLLRDHGISADVLLFPGEASHFQPAADTYDLEYMSFCRTVEWADPYRWGRVRPDDIASDLSAYNVLVGCGFAPAFCDRAGRALDIFVPYGRDLADFTRFQLASPNRVVALSRAVRAQRRGIRRSRVFQMDYTNELYESLWEKYKGRSERWWFGPPMVHPGTYTPGNVAASEGRTHWSAEFAALRDRSDLLLLYHARHVWGGSSSDPNQKGTDSLLRGLAQFRSRNPKTRISLATVEYGQDVLKSRRLIRDLGLEDSVQWFPQMYRKDLMVGLRHADIVCAEFQHSWLSSGVIYEALAMGVPLLGYRNDDLYTKQYPELYPILNARTADEVCARLESYVSDRDRYLQAAAEGREWYLQFVVGAAVTHYLEYIESRSLSPASAK